MEAYRGGKDRGRLEPDAVSKAGRIGRDDNPQTQYGRYIQLAEEEASQMARLRAGKPA